MTKNKDLKDVIFVEGKGVRKLTGKIIETEDKEFLTIETNYKRYKINRKFVVKIEETKKKKNKGE